MAGNTSLVSAYPDFVANASGYGAQDVRLGTTMNVLPGLFAVGDFAVTERAAGANMSVDIAAGRAYVDPGQATQQGVYAVRRSSSYNTNSDGTYTWAAADATNPRIDLLCIEIKDTEMDASGTTGWRFRIVDGTPNASATAVGLRQYWPAVPSGCLPIAAIRIPAGATTITTANILNLNILGGPKASLDVGVQAHTASGTIDPTQGRLVTFTGSSGQTLTLPAAVVGMRLEVWNIDTSDVVTVARGGSDTITDNLTTGATSFKVPAGARAQFVCVSSGVWRAEYMTTVSKLGTFTPASSTGAHAITGVGFRPRIVEFTWGVGDGNQATRGEGAMDAAGNQYVAAQNVLHASLSASVLSTSVCIYRLTSAGSDGYVAAFTSMDVDGFTTNVTLASATGTIVYRAFA